MAGNGYEDELPYVDGPLDEGPWGKDRVSGRYKINLWKPGGWKDLNFHYFFSKVLVLWMGGRG